MDYKRDRKRVTAIVPAYNEAERIGSVLSVLTGYGFSEIIVVDDGSTDGTGAVVSKYDVRYVKLEKNSGKGKAMDHAVSLAKSDFIFFCDADVRNLTHEMLDEIISPVVDGDLEMFIGMRSREIYALTWIAPIVPLLSGERALTKSLWQKLPSWYKDRFRVEAGLNFYAKYYGKGLGYKIFPSRQVIKERKYGFWKGTKKRFAMAADILYAALRCEITEVPREVVRKRTLYASLAWSVASTVLGAIVVYAAYKGPIRFILDAFGTELVEDPKAIFVHFLIRNVTRLSANTLVLAGSAIVVLNLFTSLLRLRKIKELSHIKAVARRKIGA